MATDKSIVMVGLPEAGKTTFLAALWHVVTSAEVDSSLELRRLDGDKNYLNSIRDQWLRWKDLPSTKAADAGAASMLLVEQDTLAEVMLHIPDLSGEGFQMQWEQRCCSPAYCDQVGAADGILLFLNLATYRRSLDLSDAPAYHAAAGISDSADTDNETPSADGKTLTLRRWDPKDTDPDIKLVDLLQVIDELCSGAKRLRVSVILSAWDLIPSEQTPSPTEWLQDNASLLWQYLMANESRFDYQIYGVSAQGCELENSKTLSASIGCASERLTVVDETGVEDHDLTRPIRWCVDSCEA